jgi:hypothetical protein
MAQEPTGAILQSNGIGIFLNDNRAPASTALFADDVVRTEKGAAARIDATGSSADIGPETIVQYEGDELVLDHGSVSVNTTRGFRVRVGCLLVTPVDNANWTHYEVVDVNGKVTISAYKIDVYVDEHNKNEKDWKSTAEHKGRSIVRQGEQKSREDKCGGVYLNPKDVPPGQGALLNSPWAVGSGVAIVAGVVCFALCRTDNSVSPAVP